MQYNVVRMDRDKIRNHVPSFHYSFDALPQAEIDKMLKISPFRRVSTTLIADAKTF